MRWELGARDGELAACQHTAADPAPETPNRLRDPVGARFCDAERKRVGITRGGLATAIKSLAAHGDIADLSTGTGSEPGAFRGAILQIPQLLVIADRRLASYADRRQNSKLGPLFPKSRSRSWQPPIPPSRPGLFLPIMAPAVRKCDRDRE
jgi:hypothetical protein